jgi:SAM-dependent methyltransferase
MTGDPQNVSARMRDDWNERAREDAHYYVAFGGRGQDEGSFDATASDVLVNLEAELRRLPRDVSRRSARALEIGCGPGRLMKPLSRYFGEIHGVDVSDEMIRLARARLRDILHAHVHATDGLNLLQFADESFDMVYSYAVFQHIPSREVVLEYLREICRVLKPGGIFRGQFNGLETYYTPTTWSGVSFSGEDLHAFTRENRMHLLDLNGVNTQYMWTTWRKSSRSEPATRDLQPAIRRATNAYTGEPLIPKHGRHAAVSLWIDSFPADCDLNNLEILIDRVAGSPCYIGPPGADGIQQVNAWLPSETRTGLLPVELRCDGERLGQPGTLRVVPAGPLVPRIVSITDGVNLVQKNRCITGHLKVQLEEVSEPESVTARLGDRPLPQLEIICIDPRAPRHEVNLRLPENLPVGRHLLQISVGRRRLLPAEIETQL